MADIQANGTNWNDVIGSASESLNEAFDEKMYDRLFDENGLLTQHMYRVDGDNYVEGVDSAHPDWHPTSMFVNARVNKTRVTRAFEETGINGNSFHELLVATILKTTNTTTSLKQFGDPLRSRSIIKKIVEDLVPKGGLSAKDHAIDLLSLMEAVDDHSALSDDLLRLVQIVYASVLYENGYLKTMMPFKKVLVEKKISISFDEFQFAYMMDNLRDEFKKIDLDLGEANLKTNHHSDRVRPSILVTQLQNVFDSIITAITFVLDTRVYLIDALFYTSQMARNLQENVPIEVRAKALALASNWSLVEFGLTIPVKQIKVKDYRAEQAVTKLENFIAAQSDYIRVVRFSAIAANVDVKTTHNGVSGHIESVTLTTKRNRVAGRDVFTKTGELLGYSKLLVHSELQSQLDGLYPADHEPLPRDMVERHLIMVTNSCDFLTRVVMDFTALQDEDRNLFALSVAIMRAHQISFVHSGSQQGKNAEIQPVFYVRPTEKVHGVETQVNLNDELRTLDPREVILLTGSGKGEASEALEGFHAQLQLDKDVTNYVDYSELTSITPLDEPIYTRTLEYVTKNEEDGEQIVEHKLQETPVSMLRISHVDNLLSSSSITNAEDDKLCYRIFMTAWAWAKLQRQIASDQGAKTEVESINSMIRTVVGDAASNIIRFTATSTIASRVVEDVVRQFANAQGIYKTYSRLYGDEKTMLNIRTYVAGTLITHFSGLTSSEVNHIMNTVDDTTSINDRLYATILADITRRPEY